METIPTENGDNHLDALRYAALTDVGLRREENQDAFGIIEAENYRAFMVADGMGGAQGGAVASRLAVSTIQETLAQKDEVDASEFLEAIYQSNSVIFNKAAAEAELGGMGTTFVGLFFADTSMHMVHCGDSRAYRIREGKVDLLTEDHTLVKELVKSGAISPEQAENHPISHMLTRSLGPSEETKIDCSLLPDGPVQGDVYLLCSDGLYNLVKDHEIVDCLRQGSLEEAAKKLIDLANERGGIDNITVMLVEVGDEYPATLEDIKVYGRIEEPLHRVEVEEDDRELEKTVELVVEPREPLKETLIPETLIPETPELPQKTEEAKAAGTELLHEKARQIESLIEETRRIIDWQKKGDSSRNHLWINFGVILVCALGLGWFLGTRYQKNPNIGPADEERPQELAVQHASLGAKGVLSFSGVASPWVDARLASLRVQTPAITTIWQTTNPEVSDVEVGGADEANQAPNTGVIDSEKQRIKERKDKLHETIQKLNTKLVRFDQPITTEYATILKESTTQIEDLTRKSEDLRQNVELATRKLAVWFDRRKRLETGDPINMASEVAVSSSSVKEKKETFEKITWDYLKELEVLRFNRNNPTQEKKVAELVKQRNQAIKILTAEVKRVIDENIAIADQHISELTLQRDNVDGEIMAVRREMEFLKSLMNASSEDRGRLKSEVTRERDSAQSELDELTRMLPDA